ncbi:hypothetical protein WME94_51845 [Sorangium sp. So ce429]
MEDLAPVGNVGTDRQVRARLPGEVQHVAAAEAADGVEVGDVVGIGVRGARQPLLVTLPVVVEVVEGGLVATPGRLQLRHADHVPVDAPEVRGAVAGARRRVGDALLRLVGARDAVTRDAKECGDLRVRTRPCDPRGQGETPVVAGGRHPRVGRALDAQAHRRRLTRRALLNDVRELVREQTAAGRRAWIEAAGVEEDVAADGEGGCPEPPRHRRRVCVGVDAHAVEVGAEDTFHFLPGCEREGLPRAANPLDAGLDIPRHSHGGEARAGTGSAQLLVILFVARVALPLHAPRHPEIERPGAAGRDWRGRRRQRRGRTGGLGICPGETGDTWGSVTAHHRSGDGIGFLLPRIARRADGELGLQEQIGGGAVAVDALHRAHPRGLLRGREVRQHAEIHAGEPRWRALSDAASGRDIGLVT